jgi:hypothetical protein
MYCRDVQVLIVEFFLTEPFVGSKEVVFSASREGASLQPGGGAAQLKGPPVEGPAVFFSCNKADAHTDPSSSHYINNFNAEVTLSKSKRDRFQQRDCTNPKAHEVHQPKLRLTRATEFEQGWMAGPFRCPEGPPLQSQLSHPTKAIVRQVVTYPDE